MTEDSVTPGMRYGLKIRGGYTRPREVSEHREVRRHFDRQIGFGVGLVTRRCGTIWFGVRWDRWRNVSDG